MKVYEILKMSRPVLALLQKSCISIADYSLFEVYEEYRKLTGEGGKKSMVVHFLAKKHKVSERRLWYIVKKFDADCKIDAP